MAEPNLPTKFPWYPVHWHEGMFLRPHHLQAADRHASRMLMTSEDWYHPFNWGFRTIELDRDAIRNRKVVLHACEARFADGTKVSIPDDGVPDPVPLKDVGLERGEGVDVLLAVPRLREQEGRANVEAGSAGDGARYWVQARPIEDDNTGGNEQEIDFRRLRCRLLLAGQAHDNYETMPIARVILSEEGSPMLDPGFVPPLLIMDAFPPLLKQVRRLHHRISSHIDTLVAQLAGTGRLFETQDSGQAERVLKLSMLSGAFSHFESVAYTHGMTPLAVYQELCRLAGHLSIFLPARRPGNLSPYLHNDLGACFTRVILAINRGIEAAVLSDFVMKYFEERLDGQPRPARLDRLRVEFDPDWRSNNRSIYLGIEGVDTELAFHECQALIGAIDMKLGGATKVDSYYQGRLRAIQLVPVSPDRPRVLPPGFVYYRIEAEAQDWQDVVQTRTMVLRFNPAHVEAGGTAAAAAGSEPAAPRVVRVLRVAAGDGDPWRKISFALFIA